MPRSILQLILLVIEGMHLLPDGEFDDVRKVRARARKRDVCAFCFFRGSSVSGHQKDLLYEIGLGELPSKSMFTTAASEDEDTVGHVERHS